MCSLVPREFSSPNRLAWTRWWAITLWPDGATKSRYHCPRIHPCFSLLSFCICYCESFFGNKDVVSWLKTHFICIISHRKALPQKMLFVNIFFLARVPPFVFPEALQISPFFLVLFRVPATLFLLLTNFFFMYSYCILPRHFVSLSRKQTSHFSF